MTSAIMVRRSILVNIWKTTEYNIISSCISFFIYLNCRERYEEMIDRCSYRHNFSSCDIYCFMMNFHNCLSCLYNCDDKWCLRISLCGSLKYMVFHIFTSISSAALISEIFLSKVYTSLSSRLEGGNSQIQGKKQNRAFLLTPCGVVLDCNGFWWNWTLN